MNIVKQHPRDFATAPAAQPRIISEGSTPMWSAIRKFAAPAALALMLAFPGAAHAGKLQDGARCDLDMLACKRWCGGNTFPGPKKSCETNCDLAHKACYKAAGVDKLKNPPGTHVTPSAGVGAEPKNPKDSSTTAGGGVATDPRPPRKDGGNTAPIAGGLLDQSPSLGSGGGGPIFRSGGGGAPKSASGGQIR